MAAVGFHVVGYLIDDFRGWSTARPAPLQPTEREPQPTEREPRQRSQPRLRPKFERGQLLNRSSQRPRAPSLPGTIDATSLTSEPFRRSGLFGCGGRHRPRPVDRTRESASACPGAADRAGEGQAQGTGAPEGAAARRQAKGPPAGKNVLTPPDKGPPVRERRPTAQPLPPGPPPGGKGVEPPTRKATEQPFERKKGPEGAPDFKKKELPKQVLPAHPSPPGPKKSGSGRGAGAAEGSGASCTF